MKAQLIVAAALLTLSSTASADSYIAPELRTLLVEVCVQTKDDDRISLRKTLNENRLSKQTAVSSIVCNGQQLTDFARSYQANRVVSMLEPYERRAKGKVSISDVAAP